MLRRATVRTLSVSLCGTLFRGALGLVARPVGSATAALRPTEADGRGGSPGASAEPVPPRLLLLSSGLTTPELESTFRGMLSDAAAGEEPSITMVVTGQMAPSNETPEGGESQSKKSPGERRRRRWADATKKGKVLAAQLGVEINCVDCAKTQGDELERSLHGAHCVWVTGGNTFFLWEHMRASGLDEMIRRKLASGALYVGCSAGAIVAGRSVSPAFWKGWDDPAAAAETDWDDPASLLGLGLVPRRSFFPHYDPSWAPLVEAKRGGLDHDVVCLEDAGPGFVSPEPEEEGAGPEGDRA